MVAVYIILAIILILFLWYRHIIRKNEFFNSIKPGDKLVAVYPGGPGAFEIVYVEDKQGDQILLSNQKDWIRQEEFLFGDAEYFTYKDWYNTHHIF